MTPLDFLYFIIALLVVLSVHEASHALVAYYLGDPTAKLKGRLTLNPIAHLDAVGSIVFLLTQNIGWGKPVPINPANFKYPVRDSALTALAGPVSNFILAFAITVPWKYFGSFVIGTPFEPILVVLEMIFHVSIFLGIFNLFPLPPLDGSKILGFFVPRRWYRQYDWFVNEGVKYFLVIILIDVFIVSALRGESFLGTVMRYLHEKVSLILLLGA